MREIKFRAWLRLPLYGVLPATGGYMITPDAFWQEHQEISYDGRWYGTETFDLEMFTGLHDKNGVEIYEGDIYLQEWKGEQVTGAVVYGDMARYWLEPYPHYRIGEIKITGEVIGNIHENPELLEAK